MSVQSFRGPRGDAAEVGSGLVRGGRRETAESDGAVGRKRSDKAAWRGGTVGLGRPGGNGQIGASARNGVACAAVERTRRTCPAATIRWWSG